jgi:ADP-ribosylglycohydrolase
MAYPKTPALSELVSRLALYSQLQHEYGAKNISSILKRAERDLQSALAELKRLPIDEAMADREPNDLPSIKKLRPRGPRRLWEGIDREQFEGKCEGALLGRMAGCTLGAPVEGWPIHRMKNLAKENGDAFPPKDYWSYVYYPKALRYAVSPVEAYTRDKMKGVPVDDDVVYTLLGLLIAEDFGPDFTTEEVARAWLKYLPYAATAEAVALANLKKGVSAKKAAVKNNPYCEWIGADIRSDPWGYMAPGWPEKAAEMAYHDAFISHRRQGIYGEMYFSAVIAAAFTVSDPVEALEIGLSEIPRESAMARAVRWALKTAPQIRNYQMARDAVDRRFDGMSPVHTLNNACLTIWGLTIGGTNLSKAIGETVAMGLDNDCTAATVGSIVGAVVGKEGIPAHWYRNFNNTVHSYLIGKKRFSISGLAKRFARQAIRVHGQ